MRNLLVKFVLAGLLAGGVAVLAQPPAGESIPPPPAPAVQPRQPECPPTTAPARVAGFVARGTRVDTLDGRLGDTLALEVENLPTLLAQLACAERDGDKRDIVLYLDDRPLLNAVAYPPTDPGFGVMHFELKRTEASRDVWVYVLGQPRLQPRPTKVSVGIEDHFAIPSDATLQLNVLSGRRFVFWLLLLVALLIGFFYLVKRSDVLRDAVAVPAAAGARRPYSLSRTQAAWWFFIILASYLFIGVVTGDFSTSITGTVLVLLGISAGTVVGSALIQANKPEDRDRQEEMVQELSSRVATASGESKEQMMSQLRKMRNESEWFFRDILSDVNGVNFHRFQIVAWTLVLGIIFIIQVYRDLAMPQFSDTLLGLMGISSGTYLGLATSESNVPKEPV